MAFQVKWTHGAEQSLETIHDQIAESDPDAASRFLEGVFETTDLLERLPFIGARYEARGRRTRVREILYRRYRIFYRVDEPRQVVYIMLVWHSARDEPEFME
jgi:toxin ParE1/3/4